VPRRTTFAPSKLVNAVLEKRWSSTSASLVSGPLRPLEDTAGAELDALSRSARLAPVFHDAF
jgi:hypothetical protein